MHTEVPPCYHLGLRHLMPSGSCCHYHRAQPSHDELQNRCYFQLCVSCCLGCWVCLTQQSLKDKSWDAQVDNRGPLALEMHSHLQLLQPVRVPVRGLCDSGSGSRSGWRSLSHRGYRQRVSLPCGCGCGSSGLLTG